MDGKRPNGVSHPQGDLSVRTKPKSNTGARDSNGAPHEAGQNSNAQPDRGANVPATGAGLARDSRWDGMRRAGGGPGAQAVGTEMAPEPSQNGVGHTQPEANGRANIADRDTRQPSPTDSVRTHTSRASHDSGSSMQVTTCNSPRHRSGDQNTVIRPDPESPGGRALDPVLHKPFDVSNEYEMSDRGRHD